MKLLYSSFYFILLIVIINLCFANAQVRRNNRVFYPPDYKINTVQNLNNLNKTFYDTLKYNTFPSIKNDFNLISGCGDYRAEQSAINIARSDDGSYLCVWMDLKTGLIEIEAQLYDKNDQKIGNEISVSDDYYKWNSQPDIVYNAVTGVYIIVWAGSGYNIKAQRISKNGVKIGSNIFANQYSASNTNNPSAAVDQNGNILITWISDSNQNIKAYYRLFSKDLLPITNQRQASQKQFESVNSIGNDTRVASDDKGRFIITWSTFYDNQYRIVIQQIDNKGDLVNDGIEVSDANDNSTNYFPTITSTRDGYYLIIWSNTENTLKGRIFSTDSGFVTPQFIISDNNSSWFTYSASTNGTDNFNVLFRGDNLYGQHITKYGDFIGKNIFININPPLTFSSFPRISSVYNGNMYGVMQGYERYLNNVYIQKYDINFKPVNSIKEVGSFPCSSFQTEPFVTYNQQGKSLILWKDKRTGYESLYALLLNENGDPIGTNFMISIESIFTFITDYYAVPDKDDNFIVSYSGGMNSNRYVFLQKISKDGGLIDSGVKIIDTHYANLKSIIKTNSNGEILLSWYDSYNNGSPVYLKKYNSDFTINNNGYSILSSDSKLFGISMNSSFYTLVMWADYDFSTRTTDNVLKGKIFGDNGKLALFNFITIDTLASGRKLLDGVCSIDDDNNRLFIWRDYIGFGSSLKINILREYIVNKQRIRYFNSFSSDYGLTNLQIVKFKNKKSLIAWNSYENINSIYLNDNDLTYKPIKLKIINPFIFQWGTPNNSFSADIFNNKLILTYESIIDPAKGFDIWSNIQRTDSINFKSESYSILNNNSTEKVSEPYPNPVTSFVSIKYQITKTSDVKLTVYNILGQKISEINSGIVQPGVYNAKFNTQYLPSGIYFIHYIGENVLTRKFLIVK